MYILEWVLLELKIDLNRISSIGLLWKQLKRKKNSISTLILFIQQCNKVFLVFPI